MSTTTDVVTRNELIEELEVAMKTFERTRIRRDLVKLRNAATRVLGDAEEAPSTAPAAPVVGAPPTMEPGNGPHTACQRKPCLVDWNEKQGFWCVCEPPPAPPTMRPGQQCVRLAGHSTDKRQHEYDDRSQACWDIGHFRGARCSYVEPAPVAPPTMEPGQRCTALVGPGRAHSRHLHLVYTAEWWRDRPQDERCPFVQPAAAAVPVATTCEWCKHGAHRDRECGETTALLAGGGALFCQCRVATAAPPVGNRATTCAPYASEAERAEHIAASKRVGARFAVPREDIERINEQVRQGMPTEPGDRGRYIVEAVLAVECPACVTGDTHLGDLGMVGVPCEDVGAGRVQRVCLARLRLLQSPPVTEGGK